MSRDTIARDFNAEAAVWDEKPARVKLAGEVAAAILEAAGLARSAGELDVLDFGCGTGLVTLALQPFCRSVTGADTSSGMLGALEAKAEKAGLRNVRTHQIDPENPQLPAGPFGLIVSSMTLHHVKQPGLTLAQLHAVSAPGGLVCLADLEPDGGLFHEDNAGVYHFGFDREAMRELLASAG
ncbi:MAG: class I SAM-dependent methyltransferase, partial [Desulfovibrionaceae bacterium]|nr:class I SAM-dependent methyltransferase [Desulfovibrionaceae bacterium]